MSTGPYRVETPPQSLTGKAPLRGWSLLAMCSGAVTGLLLLVPLLSKRRVDWLTQEDGLVEWTTAALFLFAALTFILGGLRLAGRQRVGRWVWGLLAVVFMGEEVSWFQRVLGFSTPELLRENVQGEANLHNLPILAPTEVTGLTDLITSQGLFYAGFAFYFALFPALSAGSPQLTQVANRWGFIPLPPVGVLAIWTPIFVSFLIAALLPHGLIRFGITEVRELIFAVAIAGYAWWIFTRRSSVPSA